MVQQQKIISWLSSSPQHLSAHCFAPAGWNCVDLMQSLCSHQHHFQLQPAAVFSTKSPSHLLLFFFFFFSFNDSRVVRTKLACYVRGVRRSLTASGKKLLCSLVVWQWISPCSSPDDSRVNRYSS